MPSPVEQNEVLLGKGGHSNERSKKQTERCCGTAHNEEGGMWRGHGNVGVAVSTCYHERPGKAL